MPTTRFFFLLIATTLLPALASAQPAARRETGNFGTLMMATEDGRQQACELHALHVRVAIVGGMARTEVEQVFYNPLGSDMEGTFEFELPPGAAVNRLALEVEGKLVEGEIVERQRARQVYEKIVRSMRDPALMEWQSGDRFKTQVYPVPARGTKRVVLAYLSRLQENSDKFAYRYALPTLAEGEKPVGDFRLLVKADQTKGVTTTPYDARVREGEVSFEKKDFRPRGDFVVSVPRDTAKGLSFARVAEAGGRRLFLLSMTPGWRKLTRNQPRDVIVLADTSASLRGKGFEQLGKAVDQILGSLGPKDRVRLVAGDIELRPMGRGFLPASAADKVRKFLASIQPAGGTDLMQLLLAGAVKPSRGRRTVAVYLGDGQASLGELDGDLLASRVATAYRKAGAELNAMGLGADPSMAYLHKLTRACTGRSAAKVPGRALDLSSFLQSLDEPLLTRVQLGFQGGCAKRILPDPLPNLARGERLEVMGELTGAGVCGIKLKGEVAGQAITLTTAVTPARAGRSELLPVFWARERIAHLERIAGDRKEIIALSKEFGIMSRYTSWLVLENEEAYKRHQIERRKREQQQTAREDPATGEKGPLTKAKLKEGQSVSDLLSDLDKGEKEKDAEAPEMKRIAAIEAPIVMKPPVVPDAEPSTAMEPPASPDEEARLDFAPRKTLSKKSKRRPKPRPKKPRVSFKQQVKNLERQIDDSPRSPYHRAQLVSLLVGQKKIAKARNHVRGWFEKLKDKPDDLVNLVAPVLERLPDDEWTRAKRIDLYTRALADRPASIEFLSGLVSALTRAGRAKEAFERIERERRAARKDEERLLALIPVYGLVASYPQAKKALLEISGALVENRPMDAGLRRVHFDQLVAAGLHDEALRAITEWRRYAPDFPDLVFEHVTLLRRQKKTREALRVLSELTEFNPHDFAARTAYAGALAGHGGVVPKARPEEACEQYTLAVQLNPSKRDTFRTMMAMRRSHPRSAQAIYKCIQEGVSRLPVIRDVSIVMIWEDPSVDVDLHVTEPGGEEVSYQHKESAQGGHLYYDITDGYGPEIYVLGNGKPGTYELTVVYYSGSTRNVRGKLVVMRHAGGPEETRKVYPFRLPSSNSDKQIPVGRFKLSR